MSLLVWKRRRKRKSKGGKRKKEETRLFLCVRQTWSSTTAVFNTNDNNSMDKMCDVGVGGGKGRNWEINKKRERERDKNRKTTRKKHTNELKNKERGIQRQKKRGERKRKGIRHNGTVLLKKEANNKRLKKKSRKKKIKKVPLWSQKLREREKEISAFEKKKIKMDCWTQEREGEKKKALLGFQINKKEVKRN